MQPTLIGIPGVTSYGALLLLGLVAGWWLARRRARALGVDPSHIDLMAPLLVATGLGGAVLAGWLSGPPPPPPPEVLAGGLPPAVLAGGPPPDAVAEGLTPNGVVGGPHGRALYGALIAAVAVGIGYCAAARQPLGRMGDVFAVSMAVGVGLGRIGCFLAGCCFGDVCAAPRRLAGLSEAAGRRVHTLGRLSGEGMWAAVRFPAGSFAHRQHAELGLIDAAAPASLPVHPVQLYEAGALLLLAAAIHLAMKRRRVWGEAFLAFGIGYAAIRFALEWLRADQPIAAMGLTPAQLVSVVVLTVCVILFIARRRLADRPGMSISQETRVAMPT